MRRFSTYHSSGNPGIRFGIVYTLAIMLLCALFGFGSGLAEQTEFPMRMMLIISGAAMVMTAGVMIMRSLNSETTARGVTLFFKRYLLPVFAGFLVGSCIFFGSVIINYLSIRPHAEREMTIVRLSQERRNYTVTGRRGIPRGNRSYTVYSAYVREADGSHHSLKIKSRQYKRLNQGDKIAITENRGCLGWPVYSINQ